MNLSKHAIPVFLLALVAFSVVAGGMAWSLKRQLDTPFPKIVQTPRFFEVEKGQGAGRIAARLEAAGLISSARLFKLYLHWQGPSFRLQAGEYLFDRPLSLTQTSQKLHRGDVYLHKITIAEGLTLSEVAEHVATRNFGSRDRLLELMGTPETILAIDPEARNLEGYLFPETYLLEKGTTEGVIVESMVQQFLKNWSLERQRRARQLGLSVRQVVTLASLIEKETNRPDERRLISAVFHNRLQRNMTLDCDPTVIYAVRLVKEYDGILHRSDLQLDSPYNTYLYPGLPPGPIANPGLAAIDAALDPAPTDYLFFVSANDGSHVFSGNYRDHRRAVVRYQRP